MMYVRNILEQQERNKIQSGIQQKKRHGKEKNYEKEKEKEKATSESLSNQVYLDLSNPFKLSQEEKLHLAALLKLIHKQKDFLKLAKNTEHKIVYMRKEKLITLSHTVHRVYYTDKIIYEIVGKGEDKENVLGQGSFGKVQKSHYAIQFTDDNKMMIFESERADKKQQQAEDETEEDFKKRIQQEYLASKCLYIFHDVGQPLIYKNSNNRLIAHTSLPYLGTSLDKIDITDMPLGDLLKLLVDLCLQLRNFHHMGFAHRDIKPANTVYDEKNKCLGLLDPGLAMLGSTKKGIGGTPMYMPILVHQQLALGQAMIGPELAKVSDIYAFALTISVVLGLSEDYIFNCYQQNIRINFSLIKVENRQAKSQLVHLLQKMAYPNVHESLDIDGCLELLMEIHKSVYVQALEEIEESIQVASSAINQELDGEIEVDDKKNVELFAIHKKCQELREKIQVEKARSAEIIAYKGERPLLNVPHTTVKEDYQHIHREVKALHTQLSSEVFQEPQSTWFERHISRPMSQCCCCLFAPSNHKTAVADARERLSQVNEGRKIYSIN